MAAHDDVLASLVALEALTVATPPDKAVLAMARWKLTQASRRRQRLLTEIVYPEAERATGGSSRDLAELRAADAGLALASARHIAAWDIDHIIGHWSGYRSAATEVFGSMRERILREKTVLYPLLESEGC